MMSWENSRNIYIIPKKSSEGPDQNILGKSQEDAGSPRKFHRLKPHAAPIKDSKILRNSGFPWVPGFLSYRSSLSYLRYLCLAPWIPRLLAAWLPCSLAAWLPRRPNHNLTDLSFPVSNPLRLRFRHFFRLKTLSWSFLGKSGRQNRNEN